MEHEGGGARCFWDKICVSYSNCIIRSVGKSGDHSATFEGYIMFVLQKHNSLQHFEVEKISGFWNYIVFSIVFLHAKSNKRQQNFKNQKFFQLQNAAENCVFVVRTWYTPQKLRNDLYFYPHFELCNLSKKRSFYLKNTLPPPHAPHLRRGFFIYCCDKKKTIFEGMTSHAPVKLWQKKHTENMLFLNFKIYNKKKTFFFGQIHVSWIEAHKTSFLNITCFFFSRFKDFLCFPPDKIWKEKLFFFYYQTNPLPCKKWTKVFLSEKGGRLSP